MALIKCPECGKEISDKARKCISCGYPLRQDIIAEDNITIKQENQSRKSNLKFIIPGIIIVFILIIFIANRKSQEEIDQENSVNIIGAWNYTHEISSTEIEKQLSINIKIFLTSKGTTSFKKNNTFITIEESNVSIHRDERIKTVRLSLEEKGTWRIKDGYLTVTNSSSSAVPIEAASQSIIDNEPELFSDLIGTNRVNETTKYRVIDISNGSMIIEYNPKEIDFKKKLTYARSNRIIAEKRFGTLRLKSPNGNWYNYEGYIKNNQPEGNGKATYDNGDSYNGRFVNGQSHGKGTYTWKNGSYYSGNWKNGKYHGYGKLSLKNGEYYSGNWTNSNRSGYGEQIHSTGDKYVGYYKNNLRNGTGTYTWKNGNYYSGNWKNDKRNGFGTEYNKFGKVLYSGRWINGKYSY